jgi:hypothetical protein
MTPTAGHPGGHLEETPGGHLGRGCPPRSHPGCPPKVSSEGVLQGVLRAGLSSKVSSTVSSKVSSEGVLQGVLRGVLQGVLKGVLRRCPPTDSSKMFSGVSSILFIYRKLYSLGSNVKLYLTPLDFTVAVSNPQPPSYSTPLSTDSLCQQAPLSNCRRENEQHRECEM